MKLLFKGGRIVDPATETDMTGDLLVESGLIKAKGKSLSADGAEVIDCKGLVVAPGLVDMHVHLREPGLEAKEDIASGTCAAAAGGFTTVACMANTRPIIDSSILVTGLQERARAEGIINVAVIGALTKAHEGKELSEIGDMKLAGAVAVSDDGHHVKSTRLFLSGLEYAAMFDCPVISHAEDESLAGDGYMHEGAVSAVLGLPGRPAVAEEIAIARDITLAGYANAPLHIAHVSTREGVELIRQAKSKGLRVTAEATPHHLVLTDKEVYGFDTATKVNPPLRSQEHVDALRAGLKDGTIDAIACDHAPHAFEEKDVEFRYAPSGFAGLETSLGAVLTELYHTGQFTLNELVERMTVNPARILGLNSGTLTEGAVADIVVFDAEQEWTVKPDAFYTKGKASPFSGRTLKGKAVLTVVGGKVIMRDGRVIV